MAGGALEADPAQSNAVKQPDAPPRRTFGRTRRPMSAAAPLSARTRRQLFGSRLWIDDAEDAARLEHREDRDDGIDGVVAADGDAIAGLSPPRSTSAAKRFACSSSCRYDRRSLAAHQRRSCPAFARALSLQQLRQRAPSTAGCALALPLDEARHFRQRIEVVGNQLVVVDVDARSAPADGTPARGCRSNRRCRAPGMNRRQENANRRRFVAEQEVIHDECAQFLNKRFHGLTVSKWLMNRSTRSCVERMPTSAMSSLAPIAVPSRNFFTSADTAVGSKIPSRLSCAADSSSLT